MRKRITLTVAHSEQDALAAAQDAEVIFGHRYLRQCLPHADRLQWVQSTTNGVDRLPCDQLAQRGVTLTRFTGSAEDVGHHAVALAMALSRGLHEAWLHQAEQRWTKNVSFLPPPQRATVFGTGNVGSAIARFLQGMSMDITGVKRSVDPGAATPHFDRLHDRQSWMGAMKNTDWCFLALPHTEETESMLGDKALQALPDHAIIVNVGRGETLALDSLAAALANGRLGGAALDVLPDALEPLPSDHFLWTVPRLLITPHVAAYSPARKRRVEEFVESQLQRFLSGDPLEEVVIA
jgi:phosphoglycerate dehydrogenase-like enzyme